MNVNIDVEQIVDRIVSSAAKAGSISVDELMSSSRKMNIVFPRQLAIREMVKIGWSKSKVSRYFGCSPSTVVSSCHVVDNAEYCKDVYGITVINAYYKEYDKGRAERV